VEAKTVNGPDGPSQEFNTGQVGRARPLKTLLAKGVSLARLAGADLAFNGQAFVVFDGNRLRPCRDAAGRLTWSATPSALVQCSRSGCDLTGLRPDRQSPAAQTTFAAFAGEDLRGRLSGSTLSISLVWN
jgi:hypothetical protein